MISRAVNELKDITKKTHGNMHEFSSKLNSKKSSLNWIKKIEQINSIVATPWVSVEAKKKHKMLFTF